jgi:signal transduction histidine kinase
MSILIPTWTYNYPEFWNTIRRRNLWFIKIRYSVALILLVFLLVGRYFLMLKFSDTQITAISLIALSIFVYNVSFHVLRQYIQCDPTKINCMHLSLMQMLADLTVLMLLVYFTGIIESPFYVFFIFHMVIGSMILPGIIIYTICAIIVIVYSLMIYFQRTEILPTHSITGIIHPSFNYTLSHDIIFLVVFAMLMFMTVIIANRMAKNLLKREEQLRIALDKLNQAEITKQKYILGVVHEIKTPLAAVKFLVEIIIKKYVGPINSAVEEKLIRINLRVNEGLELINNIIRISRLKLSEQSLHEYFDLKTIIKETVQQKVDLLSSKNISISFSENNTSEMTYYGDKEMLSLAFSNLISNSIKYVNENGYLLIEFDIDDKYFIIRVIDDGIGIPEKDISRVFEQFYRGSNLNEINSEGSGLGLSLVKEIIKYHHGEIKAESPSKLASDNNPGTCFIIKLLKNPDNGNGSEEKINLIRGKI